MAGDTSVLMVIQTLARNATTKIDVQGVADSFLRMSMQTDIALIVASTTTSKRMESLLCQTVVARNRHGCMKSSR